MPRRLPALIALLLGLGLLTACVGTMMSGQTRRFPLPEDYPAGTMVWRNDAETGLRVLEKIRPGASVRVLVVTGTPSWPEYWAPVLAALPDTIDMVIPTRPGFGDDKAQTQSAQTDLEAQARALAPFLNRAPDQRLIVLGQSYGTGVAIVLANSHTDQVDGLMITSPFWDKLGPSAKTLLGLSWPVRWVLPADLKRAIWEAEARPDQTEHLSGLLDTLVAHKELPVTLITGGRDTLVDNGTAKRMRAQIGRSYLLVHVDLPEGDHFLNACCVDDLVAQIIALDARSVAASGLPALPSSAKEPALSRRP